jgi:hypothetical protein
MILILIFFFFFFAVKKLQLNNMNTKFIIYKSKNDFKEIYNKKMFD